MCTNIDTHCEHPERSGLLLISCMRLTALSTWATYIIYIYVWKYMRLPGPRTLPASQRCWIEINIMRFGYLRYGAQVFTHANRIHTSLNAQLDKVRSFTVCFSLWRANAQLLLLIHSWFIRHGTQHTNKDLGKILNNWTSQPWGKQCSASLHFPFRHIHTHTP